MNKTRIQGLSLWAYKGIAARFAVLAAACLGPGCNPEYTRWMPREEDLEILHESSRGGGEELEGAPAPVDAQPAAGPGAEAVKAPKKEAEQRVLRQVLRTNAPQVQHAMESLGKPTQSLRPSSATNALQDYRQLTSEFAKEAWRVDPSALYDCLKIRGIHADPASTKAGDDAKAAATLNDVRLHAMYRDEFEEIDAAKRNRYSKRMGLALSGGGIRSASFATGVLQGLKEVKVLNEIGYLSTVSGGGYAGAWYVMQGPPGKILAPGSTDLQHLAQSGNYLVASHYSNSTSELLLKFAFHSAITPVHWLINGLLDLDVNWYMFRNNYKAGIAQAFLYETPCAGIGNDVFDDDGSMGFLSPLTRPNKPFWIINTHLALSDDPTPRHRNRSGDAFELTALRAGADAVGYVEVPSIDCAKCFRVSAGLKLTDKAPPPTMPEDVRRRRELEASLVKEFREHLGTTFVKRLRSALARRIVSARFVDEVIQSVRTLESRTLRPAGGARNLQAEITKFRGLIEASFHEKLSARLASKAFEETFSREMRRLEAAPPEEQSLRAALAAAAAGPDLSSCVMDAFEFLGTKDDRREDFRRARALIASDRNLQVKIREEILKRVIDEEFEKVVANVLERLQDDWEVRKLFSRILKALLPEEALCLRIEERTRDLIKSRELSAEATGVLKVLIGDAPRAGSIHWYKLVRANRECLAKAFPKAFETDNLVDWMAPGYGIAMSGAAVDSQSLQEGFLVSNLTQALNYDLGYFVNGWSYGWVEGDDSRPWWRRALFYLTSPVPIYKLASCLTPGLEFDFGSAWHEHTQWAKRYLLTDGGHFENLGVYALVRRGCRLIIVSDGDADPKVNDWDRADNATRAAGFADLRELEKKLSADFGAEVEMKWEEFHVSFSEPLGADFGDQPLHSVFSGEIKNLPALMEDDVLDIPVKIIFVKAAYDFDSRLRRSSTFLDAEKLETPEFPHESTGQQLYSELKVLAYRALGRELVVRNHEVFTDAVNDLRKNSKELREKERKP